LNATSLSELMDFARDAARAAGPLALEHFRVKIQVEDKHTRNQYDPVTAADRNVERYLRERISERFPDHGIVGEEEDNKTGSNRYSWIIDPIDGTRAFISGMTAWGIMLGLRDDEKPVAGIIHQPYINETFCGSAEGAWLYHQEHVRAISTSGRQTLKDAILYCTHPSIFPNAEEFNAFERVANACRMMRYGGDCYSYCLLALGSVDLIIESGLQAYDVQPLIPLIEGAGGVITDRTGACAADGGFVVAAASAELHARALELLNQ